jgi:hypothetical protein
MLSSVFLDKMKRAKYPKYPDEFKLGGFPTKIHVNLMPLDPGQPFRILKPSSVRYLE